MNAATYSKHWSPDDVLADFDALEALLHEAIKHCAAAELGLQQHRSIEAALLKLRAMRSRSLVDFGDVVSTCDALTQEASHEVNALTNASRKLLDGDGDGDSLVAVFDLLGMIGERLDRLVDDINTQANRVGQGYTDDGSRRDKFMHRLIERHDRQHAAPARSQGGEA